MIVRSHYVDMDVPEPPPRLLELPNARLGVSVDLRSLALDAGSGPVHGVLRDTLPYELLGHQPGCGSPRRVCEAVDGVEDISPQAPWDPGPWFAGADVTEDFFGFATHVGVAPLEGHVLPPCVVFFLLEALEVLEVEPQVSHGHNISGESVCHGVALPRDVLEGTVVLRDKGQLPLLPAGARVGLLGEGVHQL